MQRTHIYLTQPAGTPALRASVWMSVIFFWCAWISVFTRSSSESAFWRSAATTSRFAGSSTLTKSADSTLIRLWSASANVWARERASRSSAIRFFHSASVFGVAPGAAGSAGLSAPAAAGGVPGAAGGVAQGRCPATAAAQAAARRSCRPCRRPPRLCGALPPGGRHRPATARKPTRQHTASTPPPCFACLRTS